MKLSNFSIGARLGAAFTLLALAVVLVAIVAVKSLGASDARFENFANGVNARAAVAAQLRTSVDIRAISARNLVLVTKESDIASEKTIVTAAHERVQERLRKLKEMGAAPGVSDKARELIARIDRVEQSYGPVAQHIVDLALAGKKADAILEINEKCRPLLAELTNATEAYAEFTAESIARAVQESNGDYVTDRNLLVGVAIGAVLLAVLAGVFVTGSIVKPIARAVHVAETVAGGDLSSEIRPEGRDETARLLQALANMNGNLVRLVGEVRSSSESIATGSGQIATGNSDLSARTEQQASSLQETAASMGQLTSTVRSNAETAQQATQLASTASQVATAGGHAVQEVVSTMNDISAASHKIADIIGVIDGIAFQTNILALNAAVEAARAGEQGRGFAVVASEVRSLAQRSADAAREIKALIGDSVDKVQAGSQQVDRAGRTMGEIVEQVKRVSELIAQIGHATGEQAVGIDQVGEAVTRLDQVTQQNAALVEESAAAAASLNQQASRLVSAVGVFKLRQDGGGFGLQPA
ncbi:MULTISPECIES: methyl-accepting chemotaxis protein [Ramlibacter]|uniref:MCP four helix bundle domain-containing protein n=1 Tax=Ramlibacter aquaticus TaxID=2780094 RepID=A0ABR9SGS2_9BURK|nr:MULTISPECIES: methyl-accepting chemotaxis protein [Ramlibacter]MBE7941560.1 MCP four helix bundle domain-containing protein [Ramlibacter aquaticus]